MSDATVLRFARALMPLGTVVVAILEVGQALNVRTIRRRSQRARRSPT